MYICFIDSFQWVYSRKSKKQQTHAIHVVVLHIVWYYYSGAIVLIIIPSWTSNKPDNEYTCFIIIFPSFVSRRYNYVNQLHHVLPTKQWIEDTFSYCVNITWFVTRWRHTDNNEYSMWRCAINLRIILWYIFAEERNDSNSIAVFYRNTWHKDVLIFDSMSCPL